MKCFGILAILFLVSTAGATNKANVFTCTYVQREGQWNFLAVSYRMEPIDRPSGETVFTTGMWTEQAAPGFPNHALCGTTMGTEDDSSMVLNFYALQAKSFAPVRPDANCNWQGDNVQLLAKKSVLVKRGNFAEFEMEWLPPYAPRILVRHYFATFDEIYHAKELAVKKCEELLPTSRMGTVQRRGPIFIPPFRTFDKNFIVNRSY